MTSPFRIGVTVDPRRLSVNDSFRDVEGNIRRAVARLNELWDEIHMSESARVSRVSTAFGHITNLLNDMVLSEEAMVAGVAAEIKNGMLKIESMRRQLGMDPWRNTKAPPGSIELRNSIDSELKKLRPLYKTRQMEQKELFDRVEHLSFRLGMEEEAVAFCLDPDELLSDDKVKALDAKRMELEDVLQKRIKKVQKCQKQMSKFVQKLDENMKAIMQVDATNEEISVSDSMMDAVESYFNQLKDMFVEYVQEREFRWQELYIRIAELWDSCHVADIERMIPPSYDPAKHTDRDFDKLTTEITRLESLYAARKDVFDALTKWKERWAEKIALEEKKKSPEYFQNRGRENNVYLDAKIERTLNDYTLPKLVKTIIHKYEEYCASHPNDEIRVDGFTPPDYVKWVMDEYNDSKEVERRNRQLQRMTSTNSIKTPRTPQSLHGKSAPRTVSSSKIEPLRKRLRYDSTLSPCFNSTTASIPSVITPTKRGKTGPKHSSPKSSTPRSGGKKRTPTSALRSTKPAHFRSINSTKSDVRSPRPLKRQN
ncbi:hypothetical protein Q1695_002540 [Nippostrongylus brasiliensis]|nr:hypothetical protein Q1695_002540 [Nippostrongylus brasiliensis]